MLAAMDESFPPSLLARYRPDWVIGRGRSSVVWAVTERGSGQALALKRLPLAVMAQGWPRHPHLVAVHEQPRWEMLVMDRVRGVALRDWPSPGHPLPLDPALALLAPVLDALRALHEGGVAHGGVHGGNILVRGPADAILLEPETGRVPVLGAAPEILCGEAPNPASDVWAFGVLAYLLLTGQAPWAGAPAAMREMILEEPLIPPRQVNDALPEAVEEWLLRCLARAASRRFADAGEALEALREAALREAGLRVA